MPNSIDLGRGVNLWTEQERTLYNQLPFYLAKMQVEFLKKFQRWPKLLKPQKWTPNMGPIMKGVSKVPAPVIRQMALPNTITGPAKKDVIEVREITEQCQLYRHFFESQLMQFVPSFQDFLTDHVDFTMEDITEKIAIYNDQFLRTAIFHGSPYVWVCGKSTELTASNYWTSPNIALSKSQAELQTLITSCTKGLDFNNVQKLGQVMYNDIGATHFSGNTLPDGSDGKGIAGKYCLVHGSEVWENFINDSYLLANRPLELNIVTEPFQGSLFGRWTSLLERYELRIAADGSFPAPEIVEEGSTAYNYGDTVMNSDYINAPIGVAFAVGGEAYKAVQVGPPPAEFASGEMSMKKFRALNWNGQVQITKDVLIPTLDANNNQVLDTNKRGEYLQLISDAVMGILPVRRRNIVPILYRRTRVKAN